MQSRKHAIHIKLTNHSPVVRTKNEKEEEDAAKAEFKWVKEQKKRTPCASICFYVEWMSHSIAYTHTNTTNLNVCFTAKIYFKFIVSYLLLCHQLTIFGGYHQNSHTHDTQKLCTCGSMLEWMKWPRENDKQTTTNTDQNVRKKNDMNKIEIIKKILLVFVLLLPASLLTSHSLQKKYEQIR